MIRKFLKKLWHNCFPPDKMLCSGKAMAPLIEKREVKRCFFEKKKRLKLNLSSSWHPDSNSTRI